MQEPTPREKLYKGLVKKGLYTKTFDEFNQQFSSDEKMKKLYDGLVSKELYTKTFDEFNSRFGLKKKDPSGVASQPLGEPSGYDDVAKKFGGLTKQDQAQKIFESLPPITKELLKQGELDLAMRVASQDAQLPASQDRAIEQPSTIEEIQSAVSSFDRGATDLVKSAAGIVDIGAYFLQKAVAKAGVARDPEEVNYIWSGYVGKAQDLAFPEHEGANVTTSRISNGLGQALSMALGGTLMKNVSNATTKMAMVQMAPSGFIKAKESGASDGVALVSMALEAGIGMSEALPIGNALDRFNDATGGGLLKVLGAGTIGSLEEGIQEVFQQATSNFKDKLLLDKTIEIAEGVKESGEVGGAVGFILNAMLNSVKGRSKEATDYLEKAIKEQEQFESGVLEYTFENLPGILGDLGVNTGLPDPNAEGVAQPGLEGDFAESSDQFGLQPDMQSDFEESSDTFGLDFSGQPSPNQDAPVQDNIPSENQPAVEEPTAQEVQSEVQSEIQSEVQKPKTKKGKIYNNEAIFTGKVSKVDQKLDKESEKRDVSYELAVQEAERVVNNYSTKEVMEALVDPDMHNTLRSFMLASLKHKTALEGDLSTAAELKMAYTARGTDLGTEFGTRRWIEDESIDVAANIIIDKSVINEQSKTALEEIKKIAKDKGIEIAESDTVDSIIDKALGTKKAKGSARVKKAQNDRSKFWDQWDNTGSSSLNVTIIPYLTPEKSQIIFNIARTYVEEGVGRIEDVVEKTAEFLKEKGIILTDEQKKALASPEVYDKKVLAAIKDQKAAIKDLIKRRSSEVDKTKQTLIDQLVSDAGLTEEQAAVFSAEFSKIVDKELRPEIQKYVDSVFENKGKGKLKGKAVNAFVASVSIGGHENTVYNSVQDMFGGGLGSEQIAELIELANLVKRLPKGEQHAVKYARQLAFLARKYSNDYTKLEVLREFWYINVLSGPTTFFRAGFGAASYTTLAAVYEMPMFLVNSIISLSRGNAKVPARILEGVWQGVKKAWSSTGAVLMEGTSDFGDFVSDHPDIGYINGEVNRLISGKAEWKGLGNKLANIAVGVMSIGTILSRSLLVADLWVSSIYKEFAYRNRASWQALKGVPGAEEIQQIEKSMMSHVSGEVTNRLNDEIEILKNEGIWDKKSKAQKRNWERKRRREINDSLRDPNIMWRVERIARRASLMGLADGFLGAATQWYQNAVKIKKTDPNWVASLKFGAGFLFPFARVAGAMIDETSKYTALGIGPILVKSIKGSVTVYENGKPTKIKYAGTERTQDILKLATGVAVTMVMYNLLFDEDDEGNLIPAKDAPFQITGSMMMEGYYKTQSREPGMERFSIKFRGDDTWYSYADLPVGAAIAPLGMISDKIRYEQFENTVKDKAAMAGKRDIPKTKAFDLFELETYGILTHSVTAPYYYSAAQSYQQGLKDLQNIIQGAEEGRPEAWVDYITNPARGLMPNWINQIVLNRTVPFAVTESNDWDFLTPGVDKAFEKLLIKGMPFAFMILGDIQVDQFGYPVEKTATTSTITESNPLMALAPEIILDAVKNADYRKDLPGWKTMFKDDRLSLEPVFKPNISDMVVMTNDLGEVKLPYKTEISAGDLYMYRRYTGFALRKAFEMAEPYIDKAIEDDNVELAQLIIKNLQSQAKKVGQIRLAFEKVYSGEDLPDGYRYKKELYSEGNYNAIKSLTEDSKARWPQKLWWQNLEINNIIVE